MQDSYLSKICKVEGIQNVTNYFYLNKSFSKNNRSFELRLERMAIITDDWNYYKMLLDFRKNKMEENIFHREILEKYPYDGKSTFTELLATEVNKGNL